jgi:hypothetical protein
MSIIQQTDRLIQQLDVLTTEEIDLVIAFVEFLHYKKSIQPQNQASNNQPGAITRSSPKSLSRLRGIAKPVSVLEQFDPQTDYVNYLMDKYK